MIKLKNVKKIYQMGETTVRALDGVSLEIKKGESVSIIGKSGSGKSTLLHVLGGLDRPSEGEISWSGEKLSDLSDRELASLRNQKIGFVFQQFHLLPKTSVLENVLLPTMYSPIENGFHKRAKKILEQLGLAERTDHTRAELSGGQQQRVAIARALINQPEFILADEPTGNLDSKSGEKIIQTLKRLNEKEKITLIIVTHDKELAKVTDRIITIKDGKIISDKKK